TPWSPLLGDAMNAVCAGHDTQPLHLAQRADQGQVAPRPDVRPAKCHEQVDVRAPRAKAFLFDELEADRLVLERAEAGRIELAVHDCASVSSVSCMGAGTPRT